MTERKPPRGPPRGHRPTGQARKPADRRAPRPSGGASTWLYGVHAVREALANPRRRCQRLLLGAEAAERHGAEIRELVAVRAAREPANTPSIETAPRERIAQLLPAGAVHQGLALLVEALSQPAIEAILATPNDTAATQDRATIRPVVVILDQVTDPQNVGAVLRSAAAFGARALITTRRHAPPESGALAKAASGALEHVPYLQVSNLARALDTIKTHGFWCLGLTGAADQTLAAADPGGPVALVLGAEGAGLRRLTRESCDVMARLPTRAPLGVLNVSNAAAAALYELLGRGNGGDSG